MEAAPVGRPMRRDLELPVAQRQCPVRHVTRRRVAGKRGRNRRPDLPFCTPPLWLALGGPGVLSWGQRAEDADCPLQVGPRSPKGILQSGCCLVTPPGGGAECGPRPGLSHSPPPGGPIPRPCAKTPPGGGVWHKALMVASVTLWRRLLASRP